MFAAGQAPVSPELGRREWPGPPLRPHFTPHNLAGGPTPASPRPPPRGRAGLGWAAGGAALGLFWASPCSSPGTCWLGLVWLLRRRRGSRGDLGLSVRGHHDGKVTAPHPRQGPGGRLSGRDCGTGPPPRPRPIHLPRLDLAGCRVAGMPLTPAGVGPAHRLPLQEGHSEPLTNGEPGLRGAGTRPRSQPTKQGFETNC